VEALDFRLRKGLRPEAEKVLKDKWNDMMLHAKRNEVATAAET